MTHPTNTISSACQRITVCVLAGMLCMEVGCVSRSAYERIKAQAQEDTQTLGVVRNEVKELDQQIAGLQAANRQDDATTAELRMALQHEEEQLPIMRERAEASLTSLKGQVTALMNQSWNLARKISDLRHESAFLQSTAAQYKQEMEEAPAAEPVTVDEVESGTTQTIAAEPPAPAEPSAQEPIVAQQPAPVAPTPNLSPPVPSTPSSPANTNPAETDNSWISIILSWLTTFWNWLLS